MNILRTFSQLLALTAVLLPLALGSGSSQAQTHTTTQTLPRIDGFNVDEVKRLSPGVELNFEMDGTPGGQATLHIAGAVRNLTLAEVEAGHYLGTYTISSRDKIAAGSAVTANLRLKNQVTSVFLNESLQIGVGVHQTKSAPGSQPKIEHFNVDPAAALVGGSELYFSVFGTPGAQVDLAITGVRGKVFLPEVKSGEYANTYIIKNRDRITRNSVVTANMRLGEHVGSAILGKPLQSDSAPAPLQINRVCATCGVVESVNLIEVKGEGSYLGTIGGGVIGAILGNQVGAGTGRTVAQIAGALGGAYAGRALEAKSRTTNHFEVLVRLQNGTTQTVSFAAEPGFKVGDKVRVNAGMITHAP
ncbi:glycine zipper 2TM domain-containing protein [Rhodoferax sp.]|uniref:glycine zipper 2TM domain-containing protein n=1 Tax=Rhodoferax sp. TaxID=50421 RepID=UPI002629A344|nr:glycine zipper 2TM domain-containing protein [Rhodoferax sp.]MDD2811490.1 glycine zipper 2TM domain-containing protein [Rhodoferax sp.]